MTLRRSKHLAVIQFAPATTKETALGAFPRTRGECEDGERPCRFETCRYHLSHDTICDKHGNQTVIQTRGWDWSKPSCALDVADDGPKSTGYIASLLGIPQQRVSAVEQRAIAKARRGG